MMLTTTETESTLAEAPLGGAQAGLRDGAGDMDDHGRALGRRAQVIDDTRILDLRAAIAHQCEVVDQCVKVSTEAEKLVMAQRQRLGNDHDQLINGKILAAIQEGRLAESEEQLARLRQDLAALFAEIVEKRSREVGHTRDSPAPAHH